MNRGNSERSIQSRKVRRRVFLNMSVYKGGKIKCREITVTGSHMLDKVHRSEPSFTPHPLVCYFKTSSLSSDPTYGNNITRTSLSWSKRRIDTSRRTEPCSVNWKTWNHRSQYYVLTKNRVFPEFRQNIRRKQGRGNKGFLLLPTVPTQFPNKDPVDHSSYQSGRFLNIRET